ncbi:MAG: flagellar hook capping FlgD N-terminal domain-containing protein [Limnochordia bacterium]
MQINGYGQSSIADMMKSDNLDRDAFLRLLLTEMRYQDPISPMEDRQFLAQLAQFSSMEQMQNLNSSMTYFLSNQMQLSFLGQGAALLGKEVEVFDPELETTITGTVTSVKISEEGIPLLMVNDELYHLGDVLSVNA